MRETGGSGLVILVALSVALSATGCARTTAETQQRMLELNRQAMHAYGKRQYDRAEAALKQAVTAGEEGGLSKDALMARTRLNLGAVYARGGDEKRGVEQMVAALRLEPNVRLSRTIAGPEVNRVFLKAREQIRRRPPRKGKAVEVAKQEETKATAHAEAKPEEPKPDPRPAAAVAAAPPPEPAPSVEPPGASQVQQRVLDLNRKAVAAHGQRKYKDAEKLLLQAAAAGKEGGLGAHRLMALTHVNLGAIYARQPRERAKATAQFVLALGIQSDARLSPQMTSREAEQAFARAQAEVAKAAPAAADTKVAIAAKVEEKPREPEKPKEPEEPELPDDLPETLWCPAAFEAPPGIELPFRCAVRRGVRASKVTVRYRAGGSEAWSSLPLERTRAGWYLGSIPGGAVTGKTLQYYVEAESRPALASGSDASPNLLMIRVGAKPVDSVALATSEGGAEDAVVADEDPLDVYARERQAAARTILRRPVGRLWAALSWATGSGWHTARPLEFRGAFDADAAFRSVGLFNVLPEVGYQWSERYAFSLQARYQRIGQEGFGDDLNGNPESSAFAVLGRGYLYRGESKLQLFASGSFGIGSYRLNVPSNRDACIPSGTCLYRNDTVRGGPVLLGPGGGALYHLGPRLALGAELRMLLGVPDFAALFELGLGAQIAF